MKKVYKNFFGFFGVLFYFIAFEFLLLLLLMVLPLVSCQECNWYFLFILFAILTFFGIQYLFGFDLYSKPKERWTKANRTFCARWKNIFKNIKENKRFYFSLLIILFSIFVSLKITSHSRYIMNSFGEGPNELLGENGPLFRELLLINLFWEFIQIFIIWAVSFAVLKLIKNK